jgi:hypothetical protein
MANNNRVHYAIHAVGFAPEGTSGYLTASGVQSVGADKDFNIEQVFQLGQLDIYANIEDIPDVELTVEKILDGSALLQHLATQNATATTLASRYSTERTNVIINYYDDTQDNASGTPLGQTVASGMFVSSINLTINTDDNSTESVTLVGNDKFWAGSGELGVGIFNFLPTFSEAGEPPDVISRREHVVMASSLWPNDIPGINMSNINTFSGGKHAVHIQSVDISVDLGREELRELGQRGPYHRFIELPAEVTTTIEIIEQEHGDFVNAFSDVENTSDQPIKVALSDGFVADLGTRNRLTSVSSTGGETGGGNRTTTYSYQNFNRLTITHPADPAI